MDENKEDKDQLVLKSTILAITGTTALYVLKTIIEDPTQFATKIVYFYEFSKQLTQVRTMEQFKSLMATGAIHAASSNSISGTIVKKACDVMENNSNLVVSSIGAIGNGVIGIVGEENFHRGAKIMELKIQESLPQIKEYVKDGIVTVKEYAKKLIQAAKNKVDSIELMPDMEAESNWFTDPSPVEYRQPNRGDRDIPDISPIQYNPTRPSLPDTKPWQKEITFKPPDLPSKSSGSLPSLSWLMPDLEADAGWFNSGTPDFVQKPSLPLLTYGSGFKKLLKLHAAKKSFKKYK